MAKTVKEKLLSEKKIPVRLPGLSSGSILMNLGLTGNPDWGFDQGGYYLLVGGSGAAKTFVCFHALAEASINPAFTTHRLIYNEPELGAKFPVRKFFPPLADRLERRRSHTVEEMYYELDDLLKEGRPFVYAVDSETALTSDYALGKFDEHKTAHRKGKDAAGDFGDGKAKVHSRCLRGVVNRLPDTGSILLLVSQSRDNIGFGSQFSPETRPGGRALKFYATNEIWFKFKKKITRTVNTIPRKIGSEIEVKIKKNRDTGGEPVMDIHHYRSVGLDDLTSCIQYLVNEKHWKSSKDDGGGKITAHEFNLEGPREKLATLIEEKGLEKDLRRLVVQTWQDVEDACVVSRKSKYHTQVEESKEEKHEITDNIVGTG